MKKGNLFVIGDIHARIDALLECLEYSKFDKEVDTLIVLGDVVDGGYHSKECVDELLTIKNLITIKGNHDDFFIKHMNEGWSENLWLHQGGVNTIESYGGKAYLKGAIYEPGNVYKEVVVPVTHQEFFNNMVMYHIHNGDLFIHGGFISNLGLEKTPDKDKMWDRTLIDYAREGPIPNFNRVFVGHTTTQTYGNATIPLKFNNLWMMDTGAGWSGKLTILNVDTEEYWQSDLQEPTR